MLQPTNRLTLIDAMRPPIGFRIESGMAVTFTLDLRALLAAPAALALTGPVGVASDDGRHEPIELLHALRYHANKLTVFSQVGEIALPSSRRARRVFAFLERRLFPLPPRSAESSTPRCGCFDTRPPATRRTANHGSSGSECSLRAAISRSMQVGTLWSASTRRRMQPVRGWGL